MAWHQIAAPDEMEDGAVKMTSAGGKLLAVVRTNDHYSALDNACPHMGGPLGQGQIENGLLVCPWHGREIDPQTGQCEGFEESVVTYPVEIRDDGIYVEI